MGTKQTSLKAAKEAKRKQKAKIRSKKSSAPTAAQVARKAVRKENDFVQTVKKTLKAYKDKLARGEITQAQYDQMMLEFMEENETLNNETVLAGISEFIPQIIKTHAGVELLTRLEAEGRFKLTPDQQTLINKLDQTVVKFSENVRAIREFIDSGATVSDYTVLFLDLQDQVVAYGELTDAIFPVLEEHKLLLDEYARQHGNVNAPIYDYMEQLHGERLERVGHLYVTQLVPGEQPLHAYTPANEQPLDPVEPQPEHARGETPEVFQVDEPGYTDLGRGLTEEASQRSFEEQNAGMTADVAATETQPTH